LLKGKSKLNLILILVVLLALSLVANIIILRSAWLYYKDANAARLNPLGLSYYPTDEIQTVEKEPGQKVVVFYGDSRAAQWRFPNGAGIESGFVFIDRGVDNQTASQVAGRFEAHIRPLQPDIIILQMCINDLKTIPLFPDSRDIIVQNCKNEITAIAAKSQEIGAALIITTIFPFGQLPPERRLLWSDDVHQSLEDINTYIQSLAAENILILDTFPILADEQGIVKEEYRFDFLHINGPAYEALNKQLADLLVMVE
jgi:lysophospholipase L1-like esterase